MRLSFLASLLLFLAACDGPMPRPNPVPKDDKAVEPAVRVIAPADFVAVPCELPGEAACTLIHAGGKRLLFGVPAGLGRALDEEDLKSLDAVFLFSFLPDYVEGLDEVRNRGWRAGRQGMLPVYGPNGTETLLEGLNNALEQTDAVSFVEDGAPAGGFNAALLTMLEGEDETLPVYDTGDLKVTAVEGSGPALSYLVTYRDIEEAWHALVLQPCGAPKLGELIGRPNVNVGNIVEIECTDSTPSWPLEEPLYIVDSDG